MLPNADMQYVADAAFAPYGTKEQRALVHRLINLTQWFVDREVSLLVLACNTATVNGIDELRHQFPRLRIVGMEPAIKPAAEATDRIIVLGTESTVTNLRYHELVERWADGKTVWHVGANELVAQVEAGRLTDPTLLAQKLSIPSREPESVVIGCSHFSFLKSTLEKEWPELMIFDGADGVVAQARTIALDQGIDQGSGRTNFLTTGQDRTVRFLVPPVHFRHVDILGDTL